MTATRDRRTVAAAGVGPVPWNERSAFGRSRGIPWWGAVVLALALTVVGVVADVALQGKPSVMFDGSYLIGCVVAVCWVQRKNLFIPMVQPPLILAVGLPGVLLVDSGSGGSSGMILAIVNSFLVMAGATVATVLIGVFRLATQRRPRRLAPQQDFVDPPPPGYSAPAGPGRGPAQPTRAMPQRKPQGQSADDW